jgi:two-component system chemotaxis sensor kinase CheA
MLSFIESTGKEGDNDYSALIEKLGALQSGKSPAAAPVATAVELKPVAPASIFDRLGGKDPITAAVDLFYKKVLADPSLNSFFANTSMDWLKKQQILFMAQAFGGPAEYKGQGMKEAHSAMAITAKHFDQVATHLVTTLEELKVPKDLIDEMLAVVAPLASEIVNTAASSPVGKNLPKMEVLGSQPNQGATETESPTSVEPILAELHGQSISDSNIRVDVSLLDKLMNLVGELVLARNQVLQFTNSEKDSTFQATSQRLNLITSELQEGVMKTRMQPIGNVWSKFPRVVRDLSLSCGKQVMLEMEGKETELDKTIIEAIKDPLTHLVRNAIDHGVETPEARVAHGKRADGKLFLKAYHEGGKVNIEISDDGAGINVEKIKKKALEKSLITSDQASRMSEREMMNLIFLPGFSTADKITNVSGRGVGMDVVKTSIEKIGGTIDIQSQLNKGSTFIITTGGDRYAIPQVSLLELVRLDGAQAQENVEMIHGAPVYRLRGNLLPLVYLNQQLGIQTKGPVSNSDKSGTQIVNIVVLQTEDRPFGLVVEAINDTEEIVVKPLAKQFKNVTHFSGATIMGDGSVALILDVLGIAQSANVVAAVKEKSMTENAGQEAKSADDRQTMLLFRVGKEGRMAIPLSSVARLEEFPRTSVEKAGGMDVVQYRGIIMTLVDLGRILHYDRDEAAVKSDKVNVVVYTKDGRSVGLVVDQILDVVEESLAAKSEAKREGLIGSAVIQKKVTDLIDVERVVRTADPSFFKKEEVALAA